MMEEGERVDWCAGFTSHKSGRVATDEERSDTWETAWYLPAIMSIFFFFLVLTRFTKTCPFHYRGLECKSRKSRNIWSNRQIWPWSTEWSRAKAKRVLPRECTGYSKYSLPITQEKTLYTITRWSIPKSDWSYSLQPKMEKLYTVRKNKTGSWLWLRSWTPYCQIQT